MKFVRQLSAVIVVVAIVVGMGFALKVSPLAGLIAADRGPRMYSPDGAELKPVVLFGDAAQRTAQVAERRTRLKSGPVTKAGIKDIGQTGVTILAIIGVVVLIDSRRRDARRQALRALRAARHP